MEFELPELDRKATQKRVEAALEKYRIYKYISFDEHEANTTASYDPIGGGKSNSTSDQTAAIAVHNADAKAYRKRYCENIERSVQRLPKMEKFLIEQRYMIEDAEYMTDLKIYNHVFQPPISEKTYAKIRWKAFYKLALNMNFAVLQQEGKS
ncbi:ArpU family phage packaging/lysis transcriptional regulator [Terribacillus sp. DMT04]|uniref:ArpU family phage packaging/lysis transcriptional regulator n=1 Tax=Terribacillus sp. DMT04 TaxID=2850441 RepID=UPI001C2B9C52|nr:ArpU family phage packaging/lysis transcriptional regulator [Terribacillus sp. DMT04]QXE02809.1 transcriptional regulator [Terribacillus sp. DMT04]